MTQSKIIITYYRLSEKERREHFPDSGAASFLKKQIFASGYAHLVVLCEDGTVAAMGDNSFGQCKVDGWKDVVKVAAGDYHTVALRKDGTVLATGKNDFGQCNVSQWKDVTEIFAEKALTVGVTKDERVLVTSLGTPGSESSVSEQKGKSESDSKQTKEEKINNAKASPDSPFITQVENGWLTVKRYSGSESNVVIPPEIGGRKVECIGMQAFAGKPIKSISLPKSLKKIDESAFYQCKELKQIRIPDSVTIIDKFAFYGCEKLETAVMPKGLTFLGEGAFYLCHSLKHVYMTVEARKRIKSWLGVSFEDASIVTVGEFMSSQNQ